jgi:hypothetical protein
MKKEEFGCPSYEFGACGSVVGSDTMRVRFPMMSLDFQLTSSFQPHYGPRVDSVPGNFLRGKGQPARKADNCPAICEPIVYKMWEPRSLITLWDYAAC